MDLLKYDGRRRKVQEAFERMPRGARQECSFELKIAPTYVGGVVNGRIVDEAKLKRIESWVSGHVQKVA